MAYVLLLYFPSRARPLETPIKQVDKFPTPACSVAEPKQVCDADDAFDQVDTSVSRYSPEVLNNSVIGTIFKLLHHR
jgi:hypothetical protein